MSSNQGEALPEDVKLRDGDTFRAELSPVGRERLERIAEGGD